MLGPFRSIVAILALARFCTGEAEAEAGRWSSIGPDGHGPAPLYVSALAASPEPGGFLYAGTQEGIYRTRDGGNTWELVAAGLPIREIEISPFDARWVFAATSRGLYRSLDSGETWTLVADLPVDADVRVRWSASPGTLYASVSFLNNTPPRVFRSDDAGFTWVELPEPPGVLDLADPGDQNTVYASSYQGIFRSTDGGYTWTDFYALGNAFGGGGVVGIERENSSRIYVEIFGCSPGGFCTGSLVGTRDGGARWNLLFSGAPVTDLKIHPTDQALVCLSSSGRSIFYGLGVTCSSDHGETWRNYPQGLPDIGANVVAFDPQSTSRVYAGTSQGVFVLDFPRVFRTAPRTSLPRLVPPR